MCSAPSWDLDVCGPLSPLTEQSQKTSSWPQPPREEGGEEEYSTHCGQEVKGRSEAVWCQAGPREPQATCDLRCIIVARHGPGNSRPSLIILAGPSPHGKDSRCPHSVLPSQGREQQILSSLETWTGMMNVLEHLSYAESMTENQK